MTSELVSALSGGAIVFVFGLLNRLLDTRDARNSRSHELSRDEAVARRDRRNLLLQQKLASLASFSSAASDLAAGLSGVESAAAANGLPTWGADLADRYSTLRAESTLSRLLGGVDVNDGIDNVLDSASQVVRLAMLLIDGDTEHPLFEGLPAGEVVAGMTIAYGQAIATFERLARTELALESDWKHLRYSDVPEDFL